MKGFNPTSIITFLAALFTTAAAVSSSSENVVSNKKHPPTTATPGQPFLLLISGTEVSMAQLPMIDHGMISTVYEITGQRKEQKSRLRRSVRGSPGRGPAESQTADELTGQQMPDVEVLRKFTRRHTAAHEITSLAPPSAPAVVAAAVASSYDRQNNQGRQARGSAAPAVASSARAGTHEAAPTTRRATTGEAGGRGGKERTQPEGRRRRRSSAGSNSSNEPTNISINDGQGPRVASGAPPESRIRGAAGRPANVTSALFRGRRGLREPAPASPVPARAAPPEEALVDEAAGPVQFEDFDVHMRLGYVFVADSLGRVHRFRLSGFQGPAVDDKATDDALIDNLIDAGTAKADGRTLTGSREPATGSAAVGSDGNSRPAAAQDATQTNSINNHDANEEYVLNEVRRVSHDQSGQHPTASGADELTGRSASSTSGSSTADSAASTSTTGSQRSDQSASAEPKIIWSRTKHGFPSVARRQSRARDRESLQRGPAPQVGSVGGTSPAPAESNPASEMNGTVAGRGTTATTTTTEHEGGPPNQPPSATARKSSRLQIESENESESEQIEPADEEEAAAARAGSTNYQTQLAVDWVNNIIFVLDKCRLLMVDFEGNNELVLIDDFDQYTRPVDIKVDPLNDFLFWIQAGTFQNSIYRLDLDLVTAKLFVNSVNVSKSGTSYEAEPQAITSRHNAHAVIFDLPKTAKLFTLDHKHSKIYVPVFSNTNDGSNGDAANKTVRGDAEIFSVAPEVITHMNNTSNQPASAELNTETTTECTTADTYKLTTTQIRAYNLDGTDQGPFRGSNDKVHLFDLDEIQDLAIDNRRELIYLLTNGGKDLLEELDEESDKNATHQTAQHILDGKQYLKLIHFNSRSNQPKLPTTRSSIKKLIYLASSANTNYRRPRLTDKYGGVGKLEVNPKEFNNESFSSFVSRNAPYVFIGVVCALILSIYLIHSFVFHQTIHQDNTAPSMRDGSLTSGSSINGSHECEEHVSANSVPRWNVSRPSHSTGTSTLNRTFRENEQPYDVESTNYGESNAVDEHYRDVLDNQAIFNIDTSSLANLRGWPNNLLDLSNKLYVPVEVMQDEALLSINRVSIDQLQIEKKSPLGEGHFGTVLQGTITCSKNDRNMIIHSGERNYPGAQSLAGSLAAIQLRRVPAPSSSSSGHGSSSVSSEFVTANSAAATGDYLTPISNAQSALSDYSTEDQPPNSSNYNKSILDTTVVEISDNNANEMKFKVAIKKLKDNASLDEKRDFLQEAKLLANFNHPNIVHLIGICLDRGSTLLVMELMLGGDLIRYMQENNPKNNCCMDTLGEEDMLMICLDIVNGCCYLEELNYIHRDLAARNCLVSSRRKEERVVKLADFGLARDIYKDSYYKKLNDSAMPLKWMAPECLIEQKFTIMSDVWSFGVVMWEVMSFCQEKPYATVEPFFMKEHLTSGARLRKPTGCSDEAYKLMTECWQLDPQARPSFQECRATLIEIKSNREL